MTIQLPDSARKTIQRHYTPSERGRNHLIAYALRYAVHLGLWGIRLIRPEPSSTRPTLVKSYPCRPTLQNRIFFPKSYSSDESKLPIFLDVHGGGFVIGDPQLDDSFCAQLANAANIVVASVNYSKAPASPYPGPVNDLASIMHAIIHDPALPIDRTRVAVGGFSAGGNLCLAAAQTGLLRGAIRAAVPIYPVLDWVPEVEEKYATRRRTGPEAPDNLLHSGSLFKWAYIRPGTDLEDPVLSPFYATREALPDWLYFVAAEDDLLCHETEEMAARVALEDGESDGLKKVEVNAVEAVAGWTSGRVRCERMLGYPHAFTHKLSLHPSTPHRGRRSAETNSVQNSEERDRDLEERRARVTHALYDRIAEWLVTGPFA